MLPSTRSTWALTVGLAVALAGCASGGKVGSGPISLNLPPSSIATTSSAGPSVDTGQYVPAETARRAEAVIRASSLVAHVVGDVSYTIVQLAPGTSGTIPDLQLVFAVLNLARPIEFPAGIPYLDYPGEDEPGYGQPVPLDQALRLSRESWPAVAALQVSVDLDNGRVLAIVPRRGPTG